MSRTRIVVVLLFVVGLCAWLAFRSAQPANADEVELTYGENTEEVALHRWQKNAARHWRTLMVKR